MMLQIRTIPYFVIFPLSVSGRVRERFIFKKDHLRNVQVVIGEMKLPVATPEVPPFLTDEKADNIIQTINKNIIP